MNATGIAFMGWDYGSWEPIAGGNGCVQIGSRGRVRCPVNPHGGVRVGRACQSGDARRTQKRLRRKRGDRRRWITDEGVRDGVTRRVRWFSRRFTDRLEHFTEFWGSRI